MKVKQGLGVWELGGLQEEKAALTAHEADLANIGAHQLLTSVDIGWQGSELGQDLKRHAQHLFEEQQSI